MYNPKSISCNVSTASPMAEKLSERLEAAREALDSMDDFARMEVSINPIGPRKVLEDFIEAAAELARRVEWMPIETAPRSGIEFLSVANYTDEPRQVQIVDWEFVQQCQPGLYTHWMPLPTLPAIDNAQVKETEA